MKDKLKRYVDLLFEGAAKSEKNDELREELLGNLYDRYNGFIASGMSEEEAYNRSVASIGDLSELLDRGNSEENKKQDKTSATSKKSTNEKIPLYSDREVERKKKLHPILHAIAVALYILCVVPSMIWNSNLASVLLFVMVAAATSIFIYTSYTKPVLVSASLREKERAELIRNKSMAGIMRAVGVALYIMCVCPVILVDNVVSVIMMFAIIAAATAIMILTSSLFPINAECENQFKESENKKEANKPSSPYRVIGKILSAILWIAVIVIYLAISFHTNRWWITWLIFPIAGLISGIISGIFNLILSQKIAGSIVKISLCSVFLCCLLPLFTLAVKLDDFNFDLISFVSADSSFYADSDDLDYLYGTAQFSADEVLEIDISWVSGKVVVETWDEDFIEISESGCDSDDYIHWVHSKLDNGKLTVKFSEAPEILGFISFGSQESKTLTIKLPDTKIVKSMQIDSISSDIELYSLSGIDVDLSNVSGNLTAIDCFYRDIDVESVSGNVDFSGGCRNLDISMVSGKIETNFLTAPEDISIETVSGNITIEFPEDISGFSLTSDSISDKVDVNHDVERRNGRYIFGDGSTEIDIESVSGKITVK